MILEFSDDAILDRNQIYERIFGDTSRAADAHDDVLWDALNRLTDFPFMGRKGRIEGTLELPIASTQYVAMYSVHLDRVLIHRILHGKQQWPTRVSL